MHPDTGKRWQKRMGRAGLKGSQPWSTHNIYITIIYIYITHLFEQILLGNQACCVVKRPHLQISLEGLREVHLSTANILSQAWNLYWHGGPGHTVLWFEPRTHRACDMWLHCASHRPIFFDAWTFVRTGREKDLGTQFTEAAACQMIAELFRSQCFVFHSLIT